MKRDCFVIPCNYPKVNWLVSFINSIEARTDSYSFDLIIGASDEDEFRKFTRLSSAITRKVNIVVVDISAYIRRVIKSTVLLERYHRNSDGCIVNLKKFLLLKWASDHNYRRICSIDGDTAAARDMDGIFDVMEENYNRKLLIGTHVNRHDIVHITNDCLRHFDESETAGLRNEHGIPFYSWFFDAPYYANDDLNEFFQYMSDRYGSLNDWLETITYRDFEHQIFHYWLVLRKNAATFGTSEITRHLMPESLLYSHFLAIRDYTNYSPVWVYAWEYMHQPDIMNGLPTVFMLSHFDRMSL